MRRIAVALLAVLLLAGAAEALDVRVISLPTNDIVYDPGTGRIFASVPSRAGANGNSIVAIDPVAATVGGPVPVGSEPNRLTRTDNGQFLYVGLDGQSAVRQFAPGSQSPGLLFGLGASPDFGPRVAGDLQALPGNPGSVAVSMRYVGVFPGTAGLAIFDGGVPRPVGVPEFSVTGEPINTVAFSALPSLLYSGSTEASPPRLYRLAVDGAGVSIATVTQGLVAAYGPELVFEAGLIYAASGEVVNPEVPTVVGTLPGLLGGALVRPDNAAGRIFVLTGTLPGVYNQLASFDAASLQPLGSVAITGVAGKPSRLLRWGADGLAFRTSADQVVIIRGIFAPSPPPADVNAFITSLYVDVLGRQPAPSEVTAWVDFLRVNPSTASVSAMTHTFLDGPEFLSHPATAATYVTLLYNVFLGRGPDGPGLQGWVDQLLTGFNTALPGFVNSPEFRALVPDLHNRTAVTTVVTRLYDLVLGRTGAASEVSAWVDYVLATGDLLGVANGFFASPEYNGRARTLSQHVIILYRTFLGRDPAASEIPQWVDYLQTFRMTVEDAFIGSPEFQGRLAQFDLTPKGSPPAIGNLLFNPTSASRASGTVTVTGSVSFTDPDGDVAFLRFTVVAVNQFADVPVAAGTSGNLVATVRFFTNQTGTSPITVQAFDRKGNVSNSLTGTFTITP